MYQIPQLLKIPGLFHAFSTSSEGNMANVMLGKEQDFEKVAENRKKFLLKAGIDIEKTVCMWVEHGNNIIVANPAAAGRSIRDYKQAVKCDGLISKESNLFLFLLVADCLPVIAYDPENKVVGLLHYGWKNADLNTADNFINIMIKEFGINPKTLIVALGPSIRKDSYVKTDPQQKNDPKWSRFAEKITDDKYKIDVVGMCVSQLKKNGILSKNIIDCKIDTYNDERFYSHYRDGKTGKEEHGRFACVVGLNK